MKNIHILPIDKSKQESLEEAAKKKYPMFKGGTYIGNNKKMMKRTAFIKGAKWMEEQMYSEEEVKNLLYLFLEHIGKVQNKTILNIVPKEWFEQFRKK